jgi:hypothetical protein
MSQEKENEQNNLLVGYVRLSKNGGAVNLSVNVNAMAECKPYETADGEKYVSMTISKKALLALLAEEKQVTSITHWL